MHKFYYITVHCVPAHNTRKPLTVRLLGIPQNYTPMDDIRTIYSELRRELFFSQQFTSNIIMYSK